MLENLDSVQWDKLRHAYGTAEDVPDLLRAVDTANTLDEFEKAYADLWNVINHQGTIYEATSYATRFIIQMLVTTPDPDRKSHHLLMLAEFLRNTQDYSSSYSSHFRVSQPIIRKRFDLELYDAISEGIDHYLDFLFADDLAIQCACAYVLSFLVDQYERSLPALIKCVEQTENKWLQAGCVWAYAQVAHHSAGFKTEPHEKQLQEWVQYGSTFHMNYAATLGHLKVSQAAPASMIEAKHTTPDFVVDVVARGLATNIWESTVKDTRHILHYIYAEFTPFDSAQEIISRHCSNRPHTWIAIIKQMTLSPTQAHLYFRDIMDIVFLRNDTGHKKWHNLEGLNTTRTYETLHYRLEKQSRHYQADKSLNDNQKFAIEAIVACDPFWEMPTNLFSFFYGLPDDREALRLLASTQA